MPPRDGQGVMGLSSLPTVRVNCTHRVGLPVPVGVWQRASWGGVLQIYTGRWGYLEQAEFGMAKFGTTKFCQILPRNFRTEGICLGVMVVAFAVCACSYAKILQLCTNFCHGI